MFFSDHRAGDLHEGLGSEAMILLLTIASGLTGILLGRSYRVYTLIPAIFIIAVAAFFLGRDLGMISGFVAFALGAAAIQICYFVTMVVIVLIDNFSIEKAPSESSIFLSLQN